jgi:lysophospholipase L1-like esterase
MLFSLSALVSLELGLQIYVSNLLSSWAELKSRSTFYFSRSTDETLGYELASNLNLNHDNRILAINSHGVRDSTDDLYSDRLRLAVLGDSVAFGMGHTQAETISELLQDRLDVRRSKIKCLNFGVPGYGLDEIARFLQVKDAVYGVDHVVYILNANDFARRNTVYEGADDGLYRLFVRPRFALPWMTKKLIYRWHKGGGLIHPALVSAEWYRWLYAGNREHGFSKIEEMREYCSERRIAFSVILLPAGCAYRNQRYELADMYREIAGWAKDKAIDVLDCSDTWGGLPDSLFDATDHLTRTGNQRMAMTIAQYLGPRLSPRATQKSKEGPLVRATTKSASKSND